MVSSSVLNIKKKPTQIQFCVHLKKKSREIFASIKINKYYLIILIDGSNKIANQGLCRQVPQDIFTWGVHQLIRARLGTIESRIFDRFKLYITIAIKLDLD